MRHHHALRLPRRPRRVDHVRRLLPTPRQSQVPVRHLLPFPLRLFPHHHRGFAPSQPLRHRPFRHHAHRPAVLHHRPQPILRILCVQRHISCPALHHRQRRHHHLHRSLHRDPHPRLRARALLHQPPRHPIGSRIQFPVAPLPAPAHHRYCFRLLRRFPLPLLHQRRPARLQSLRRPLRQYRRPLLRAHHSQAPYRPGHVPAHPLQHRPVVPHHLLHPPPIEQIPLVLHLQRQPSLVFHSMHFDIKSRLQVAPRHRLQFQFLQPHRLPRRIVQPEGNLKHRRAVERPFRR